MRTFKVIEKSNLRLKPFNHHDAEVHLSRWMLDDAYSHMWRNLTAFMDLGAILNFPAVTNNHAMFIEDLSHKIVGIAIGYGHNFRNQSMYIGTMIDKDFWGMEYGRNSQALWTSYVIEKFGLRKVMVEVVDKFMIKGFEEVGYKLVSHRKEHCRIGSKWFDEYELECFSDEYKVIYKAPFVEGIKKVG